MASAWATLVCYASMTIISYYLGQKHYPIPYDLKKVFTYGVLAAILFTLSYAPTPYDEHNWGVYAYHLGLLAIFASVVYILEKPGKKVVISSPKNLEE